MNERVKEKEDKLNRLLKIINKLEKDLDTLSCYQNDLIDINNYYGSNDYYIDLEAYDKGLISTPCGVLAEDTIWNMLEKLREEKERLNEIVSYLDE